MNHVDHFRVPPDIGDDPRQAGRESSLSRVRERSEEHRRHPSKISGPETLGGRSWYDWSRVAWKVQGVPVGNPRRLCALDAFGV